LRPDHRYHIAVVGSGPSGFFAAASLLKAADASTEFEMAVDMLEMLPTPWGLVRSGVAPDHPKIKSVSRVYEKTARHPRFRFHGNVEIGADVTHAELEAAIIELVIKKAIPAKLIDKNTKTLIIDVRDPDEFEKETIKGAINIPLVQLEPKLRDIPKDTTLVFTCNAGLQSAQAAKLAEQAGFKTATFCPLNEWKEKRYHTEAGAKSF